MQPPWTGLDRIGIEKKMINDIIKLDIESTSISIGKSFGGLFLPVVIFDFESKEHYVCNPGS